MVSKSLIIPELRRVLKPPFAWIDRRFLFNGILAELSVQENLLYFFLVLVADRNGLSFYSYDKICQLLKLNADDYVQARDSLMQNKLIAHDGFQFQVLTLPEWQKAPKSKFISEPERHNGMQTLAEIFSRLGKEKST